LLFGAGTIGIFELLVVKLWTLFEDLLSGKKQQGMMDCVVAISML
jgi:hypothetical protein